MNTNLHTDTKSLIIAEGVSINLGDYHLDILSYLGCFTPNIHAFKVDIKPLSDEDKISTPQQLGLLRVESLDGGLNRELNFRESLNNYGLIAQLLAHAQFESVIIDTTTKNISINEDETSKEPLEYIETEDNNEENTTNFNNEPECLKEENLLEESMENYPSEKLLLLTQFPSQEDSLEQWLNNNHSQEESLSLIIQLCQCCFHFSENNWCLVNLVSPLIEFKNHLRLYDLTQVFPVGSTSSNGLMGGYCALELAINSPITALMSTYTVGAILYQIIHHQLPSTEQSFDLKILPIPRFYQLLKIALSPIPEERFSLSQFRQLLLETRAELRIPKVNWITASCSTVGLSLDRLQNEDNFGVRQQQISDAETMLIGVVADGMGGMEKGEIASKIAVETVLKEVVPTSFKSPKQRNTWLIEVFQKANQEIASVVENGGTTLSMILAVNEQLMIAHVGDSRIYLLRQGKIQQLSQDHSYVALLVNNGDLTEEESRNHPDRSILLRSLGSKNSLSNDYVQNLTVTTNNLTLTLEDHDILLLCSDGVWDLISKEDLQDIFANYKSDFLSQAVDTTIQKVLEAGASDNATLLALQYFIKSK